MIRTHLATRVSIVLLVLIAPLMVGCARSRAVPPEETITLLYDVRDLIHRTSSNNNVVYDEHGWPRLDISPSPPAPREQLVDALKQLIMQTIDPISWRDRANGPGIVDEAAGQLMVTQTPENHAQVKRLIEQLRETRSVQITLQTYVIKGDDVWKQIDRAGGKWHEVDASTMFLYLTDEQMQELVAGRKQDAQEWSFLTAPRLTMFNGQRAHVIVATETAYVGGYAPADGAPAGGGFKPVTKLVNSGVAVDCVPTVNVNRRHVTLTLRPRLSALRDVRSARWPDAPAGQKHLEVQVPHTTLAGTDLTVSVPDKGWVLVRIIPKHQPPNADLAAAPEPPVLFAFGPTVIEPARK